MPVDNSTAKALMATMLAGLSSCTKPMKSTTKSARAKFGYRHSQITRSAVRQIQRQRALRRRIGMERWHKAGDPSVLPVKNRSSPQLLLLLDMPRTLARPL
jgi:hypothetical protein